MQYIFSHIVVPGTSWLTGLWRWPPWRTSPVWYYMWPWVVWIATWPCALSPRLVCSYWELPVWWFVHGEMLPRQDLQCLFLLYCLYSITFIVWHVLKSWTEPYSFKIISLIWFINFFSGTSVKKSWPFVKLFGSQTTHTNMRTWFGWWERLFLCWRERSGLVSIFTKTVQYQDHIERSTSLIRRLINFFSPCTLLQSPTLPDYGEVLLSLLPMERRSTHLFSYVCELSLLYSALSTPPPAKLACAALLLTRALHHYGAHWCTLTRRKSLLEFTLFVFCESLCSSWVMSAGPVWPTLLCDYTGFSKQDLVPLSVLLYVKW